MIDSEDARKLVAKELRRGDASTLWLDGWSDAAVEELRADLAKRIKRAVRATRLVAGKEFVLFEADPKSAKPETKEPGLWD